MHLAAERDFYYDKLEQIEAEAYNSREVASERLRQILHAPEMEASAQDCT